jgi:probable F420-dependent oxidoreductase
MIVAILAQDLNVNSGGRFVLGLGSQVKQHNERRFSTPWTPPAPRMGEYVQALRAIWRRWENAAPLNFKGEHYNFTLMTPAFSPPPTSLPTVPITIAAIGPAMLRLAGRHCDGVRLHAFCTRAYAEQVVMPEIEKGLSQSRRKRENFEVAGAVSSSPGRMRRLWRRAANGFGATSVSTARLPLIGQSWNCMGSATSRRSSITWSATATGRSSPPKYPMRCSICLQLWAHSMSYQRR